MTVWRFAQIVGCSDSLAEKIKAGTRAPSAALLARIVLAFDLDGTAALRALALGPEPFGAWLRVEVFGEAEQVAA